MPVNNFPDLGVNVDVTLVNGSTFVGYWDGLQWWVGVPDDPNDLPLVNSFVEHWTPTA